MKMNYSQSAGYIETHYVKDFFEMSEETLFDQYKEELALFVSGNHIKATHDTILASIEKAIGSMFGDELGIATISSVNKQDNYAIQLDSINIEVSPNYVMYEEKPFIIGPYVQYTYDLGFMINIPTIDEEDSELYLPFHVEATGEEEGELGCFDVSSDIFAGISFMEKGKKIETYQIKDYVKEMINQHIKMNKVKPLIGNDVKAFNKLLLKSNPIMLKAE